MLKNNYFFKNKVVILRHGQTEWNFKKRTMGHLNSPLTKKGIAQAKKATKKLKEYNFDIVISSPLGRAKETAKIIADRLNISDIKTNPVFSERNFGIIQGRRKEELLKKFPHFWNSEGRFISTSKVPEGESFEKFLERVHKGLNSLRSLSEQKNIILVTHSWVVHAIISRLKGIKFSDVRKFYNFDHCEPIFLS